MYFITWVVVTIVVALAFYCAGEEHWLGYTVAVSIFAGVVSAIYKKIGLKRYWLK